MTSPWYISYKESFLKAHACSKLECLSDREPWAFVEIIFFVVRKNQFFRREGESASTSVPCWMLDVRFGPVVKGLLGYIEKVESSYAAKRTLFRGMRLPEQHLLENYAVGRILTWHAFSSVTTNRQLAESYCLEDYDRGFFLESGIPVLFIISTYCRGALLGSWTPHTSHDELLLSPFVFFQVMVTTIESLGTDRVRVRDLSNFSTCFEKKSSQLSRLENLLPKWTSWRVPSGRPNGSREIAPVLGRDCSWTIDTPSPW